MDSLAWEIDRHGYVTEVTTFDGGTRRRGLGRVAELRRNSGRAYWHYKGQSVRAWPQYDLKTTYRTRIDQNTGAVYRVKYIGSKRVGNQYVSKAALAYATNGRPFYKYGSTWVWANKPWRQVYNNNYPPQNNGYPGQNNQYPGQNNQSQGQNNGAALATGILQIIGAALNDQQRR